MEPKVRLVVQIDHLQCRKRTAAVGRPSHSIVLLALGNYEVIRLFYRVAGIAQAEPGPERITGYGTALFPKYSIRLSRHF